MLRASKVHTQVTQETDRLPLRHSHSFQQTTDLQVCDTGASCRSLPEAELTSDGIMYCMRLALD